MKNINFKLSRDEMKYIRNITFLALILNFIIEVLNTNSLIATLNSMIHKPHIFIYNACIILVTLSITLLTKRRLVFCSGLSILWLGFGITNNILLKFRTTPFTAVDISLMSEAIPIMDKYLTHLQIILLAILVVLVIIGLIFAFIKLPKHKEKIHYLPNVCAMAMILVVTMILTTLGMKTNVLAKNFGNIGDAFKDYGFAYCFTNSLINTGIDKPSNYSEEIIQDIVEATVVSPTPEEVPADQIDSDKDSADATEGKTPNIIFLQLESFFDPTLVKGLTFSSDPLPNYHMLEKNYTTGYLNVPSVGAGTANTEFEIISGMNLDFFGPGEYPYKTILKEKTCESMAYNLHSLNYSTHAIHNNTATFYGRNKVFPNLGFDSFTSIEYMENVSYNPLGWAKDDVLVEEIMKALNSTDGNDYIYTISVQGHGKYPQDAETLYKGNVSEGIDGDFKKEPSQDLTSKDTSLGATDTDSKGTNPSSGVNSNPNASGSPIAEDSGLPVQTGTSDSITEELKDYVVDHEIKVNGLDETRAFAFEYYVNQIHEMDAFIGKLIETLDAYDEDVVLVMYGDHLPSLGINAEDLDNGNIYQTEYIIWNSKGVIEGKHDRDVEAYQLSAYTLSLLQQNPGILTKLHQKELSSSSSLDGSALTNGSNSPITPTPGITSNNTADDGNNIIDNTAIPYLDELKLLQYDMLYGKQECFNKISPYLPTTLKMGVLPITIDSVELVDGHLQIHGQNFTSFSKIMINGEEKETKYHDPSLLSCKLDDLGSGSYINVRQVNEEATELSRTDDFITK